MDHLNQMAENKDGFAGFIENFKWIFRPQIYTAKSIADFLENKDRTTPTDKTFNSTYNGMILVQFKGRLILKRQGSIVSPVYSLSDFKDEMHIEDLRDVANSSLFGRAVLREDDLIYILSKLNGRNNGKVSVYHPTLVYSHLRHKSWLIRFDRGFELN